MACEILFVGDVHLGRRPRRLPDDLDEFGLSVADLTPAAALRNVVRHARAARVAAVVFAGDVVESENARFEAYGQLHRAVTELDDAGIPVFAVAGNHDVDALPRLADAIPSFRLLGRGGRWEEQTVRDESGRPLVRLLGWSFAHAEHVTSPLAQPDLVRRSAGDGVPRLGVLHCDLLASTSRHAPVTLTELRAVDTDGWFLGHIHKPSDLTGSHPIGYLGSLVGLDPSECGTHGAWVVRVADTGLEVERLPLAPLAWVGIDAAVDAVERIDQVERAVREAIEAIAADCAPAGESLRAVGCRIRLTGTTRDAALLREIDARPFDRLRVKLGPTLYFVERVVNEVRRRVDLPSLASRTDPPGLLAALLQSLERDDEDTRLLLQDARGELQRLADDRRWSRLSPVELDDRAVRRRLLDAGRRALAELLEQSAERRS